MNLLRTIQEAISDLSCLQIATLYGSGLTLASGIDTEAKADLEKKIAAQLPLVNTARAEWLAASEFGERMGKRRAYRDAKARLSELQQELDGVNPSEIFAKIQLAMKQSTAAGYTRLDLNGDSTNYVDAGLGEDNAFLIEAHKANVQAAQEARQRILDTATSLLKLGKDI
jgi:hypothetical protein